MIPYSLFKNQCYGSEVDRRPVSAEARVLSKALPRQTYQTSFSRRHYYINAPYSLIHPFIRLHVTNTMTRLATDRVVHIKAKVKRSLSTA